MTVKITGLKELNAKLRRLGDGMEDAIDKGVFVTAQDVRSDAIRSIQEVSPGRPVTRYKQGGAPYTHTAAGAGQAPNTDTGTLVKSIAVEKVGEATYHVGSNLDYAEWLEMGTSQMSPRPWLYPALDFNKGNLIKNVGKVVDIQLDKAGR